VIKKLHFPATVEAKSSPCLLTVNKEMCPNTMS
jgi:hypothetical protein